MDGKRYELEFLPLFEEDMKQIVDYIALKLGNPTAAHRLVDEVQQAIHERLTCAESFEPFPSTRHRRHPYYRIRIRNYTIFYVVIGDVMEVRRIIYSRRDIEKQL